MFCATAGVFNEASVIAISTPIRSQVCELLFSSRQTLDDGLKLVDPSHFSTPSEWLLTRWSSEP